MEIADRVRAWTHARGWNESRLAREAGLDASVVAALLQGHIAWDAELIARVAVAFAALPRELLESTDDPVDVREVDACYIPRIAAAHATVCLIAAQLRDRINELQNGGDVSVTRY